MLLCTGNWPLEKIIEEKALVLWEKILRTPRYLTLWSLESPSQWLRIYTNGSGMKQRINAGAVVFCDLFSVYASVGRFASAYDVEVEALRIALTQLQCRTEQFTGAVIISDHPAMNILAERNIQSLKNYLKTMTQNPMSMYAKEQTKHKRSAGSGYPIWIFYCVRPLGLF
ncbi:hypothetical protein CDAR_249741 [Caerostris darwini]|uniref:Uncharacterized protein n=1 Tax=Caerostris darwini TaxID=1538125 RepID=A0AAV4TXD3_9ARAC|nr:hypothetical protein CDAR_249741 [Caerostris darwini]